MVYYPYKKQIKRSTRKRYGSKGKGYKIGNMIKDGARVASLVSMGRDIQMLKGMLNTEKKKVNRFAQNIGFGLSTTGTSGTAVNACYCAYLHPDIPQGSESGQRTGNSVKMVSAMFQAQFTPQANADHDDLSFKWYIINKQDANQVTQPDTLINQFLDVNPFTGFVDTFSNRDPEFFTQYKIIATGAGKLKMSETDSSTKLPTWNVKQPLKFNLHQKYDSNTSTVTTKNQLYILCIADGGDPGLPDTGIALQYTMDYYYVDN